jgi:predicted DsbA family dithiol-disulfide isomerase
MIPLDILSDPVCPWCYIGKRRLDLALAETGLSPFAIRWRMFRLNPEMPREGMDRRDYLEAKFGGPEKAAEVYARIAEAAEASGLALALDRIERTPDTTDAHRVLHWAAAEGAAHAAAEALFRRYFVEGRDISEPAVLADAAEEAGMERAVVARLLEGEADREALLEEERAAREMGVTGVPCFVINGRHVLQGAQERDTWASVIRELDAALTARPGGEAE